MTSPVLPALSRHLRQVMAGAADPRALHFALKLEVLKACIEECNYRKDHLAA